MFWNHWFSEQNVFEKFLLGKSMVSKPIFQKIILFGKSMVSKVKLFSFFLQKHGGSSLEPNIRFARFDCTSLSPRRSLPAGPPFPSGPRSWFSPAGWSGRAGTPLTHYNSQTCHRFTFSTDTRVLETSVHVPSSVSVDAVYTTLYGCFHYGLFRGALKM